MPAGDKTIFFRKYEMGAALKKLKSNTPDKILNLISFSNLEGRGGAFFSYSQKVEKQQGK